MGLTVKDILQIITCFCVMLGSTLCRPSGSVAAASVSPEKEMVRVGVILENSSTMGKIFSNYIGFAWSDFYEEHPSYLTRLSLYFRDPNHDVVAAASAAVDLIENEEVHAIIGPFWSLQAKFVMELGTKAQVPIVSFSATSPSFSPANRQYFVRTAYVDSSQVGAIAAIVQAFGWREVVPIYEDTEFGNGLIPYIIDAFQAIDVKIPYRSAISPSSRDEDILGQLNRLMMTQTRVFMVHMTTLLGSRLFDVANEAGMLNKDTVWIVTDGMSSLLDAVEPLAMDSMQGVLGVRPYLPMSDRLKDFKKNKSIRSADNLLALWAYDTVWALGDVVEKVWNSSKSQYGGRKRSRPGTRTASLVFSQISEVGPDIARYMRNYKVNGLSGHFQLVNGQLQPSAFEVFNVVGRKERVIGYWTPKHGLSKSKAMNNLTREDRGYSTSMDDLKPPLWPGETLEQPKGWVIPVKGKKMKIGVPVKSGFKEFIKVEWDLHGNPTYSGFSYDVFLAVLDELPFAIPYEFVPFMNSSRLIAGSYSDMLYRIKLGEYDMIVGDTTIVANRSAFVDFSLPYSESGVSMLVAIKDDERRNMWIFLKPLKWDLWLTAGMAFMFTGLVVWVLERHNVEDFRGSHRERLGISLWFSFSTLIFAHRERVSNNLTRVVLVIWVFVVLIITQSYTASLASFLTVQRLQPKFVDVQDLIKNRRYVGFQKDSFTKDLLVRDLKFDPSMLKPYASIEDYHEALSKGGGNGGADAIFDEIPYLKLFLAKHCNEYMMVGPTYKTDGFGFAFRQGSPMVSYFSRAVLTVTEDKDKIEEIERKNSLSPDLLCKKVTAEEVDGAISMDNLSLSVYSFGGLFIITTVVSLFAVLVDLLHSHFYKTCFNSLESRYGQLRQLFAWSKVISGSMVKEVGGNRLTLLKYLDRNRSRVVPLNFRPATYRAGVEVSSVSAT